MLFIRTLVTEPYAGVNTDVYGAQSPFKPPPGLDFPTDLSGEVFGEPARFGAHLVVVEVPVDGEAVPADAPLLAGGAGAAPASYAHVAPCPHQLRRLLQLRFGGWKKRNKMVGGQG